jgi:hypothetical protein
VIVGVGERAAERVRTGEDVMLVAGDLVALASSARTLDVVASLLVKCKIGNVLAIN